MRLYMVEICVRDWSGTRAWYRDKLDLEETFVDEPNRFVQLRAGDLFVALKAGTPKDAARDAFDLAFEVNDVDVARSRLIARGVEVDEPFNSPYQEGYREARLKDPEGTRIRLFSWLNPKG